VDEPSQCPGPQRRAARRRRILLRGGWIRPSAGALKPNRSSAGRRVSMAARSMARCREVRAQALRARATPGPPSPASRCPRVGRGPGRQPTVTPRIAAPAPSEPGLRNVRFRPFTARLPSGSRTVEPSGSRDSCRSCVVVLPSVLPLGISPATHRVIDLGVVLPGNRRPQSSRRRPDASEVGLLELRGHLADNGGLRACFASDVLSCRALLGGFAAGYVRLQAGHRLSLLLRTVPRGRFVVSSTPRAGNLSA